MSKSNIKAVVLIAGIILAVMLINSTVKRQSIENMDYAVCIEVNADDSYKLYVADLLEYKGSAAQMLETRQYIYKGRNLSKIREQYNRENKRDISFEHVRQIVVNEELSKQIDERLMEMGRYIDVSDNVSVMLKNEENPIGYRRLINNIYEWEN